MNFHVVSGDITITIPPLPRFFAKKKGGIIEKNFVKDLLSKNFSGASRQSLEGGGGCSYKGGGGVVIVISPDTVSLIKFDQFEQHFFKTYTLMFTFSYSLTSAVCTSVLQVR